MSVIRNLNQYFNMVVNKSNDVSVSLMKQIMKGLAKVKNKNLIEIMISILLIKNL
jgi:hypothetical protein